MIKRGVPTGSILIILYSFPFPSRKVIISSSDTYCVLASTIPAEKAKIQRRDENMIDLKIVTLMIVILILRKTMAPDIILGWARAIIARHTYPS
jgi:hypothetical protein